TRVVVPGVARVLHPRRRRDIDLARLRRECAECLTGRGGEASARQRAAALAASYLELSEAGRGEFLHLVASEFGVPDGIALDAARRVLEAQTPQALAEAVQAARRDLEAPWVRLLRQFAASGEGAAFLVKLRADLRRRLDL